MNKLCTLLYRKLEAPFPRGLWILRGYGNCPLLPARNNEWFIFSIYWLKSDPVLIILENLKVNWDSDAIHSGRCTLYEIMIILTDSDSLPPAHSAGEQLFCKGVGLGIALFFFVVWELPFNCCFYSLNSSFKGAHRVHVVVSVLSRRPQDLSKE